MHYCVVGICSYQAAIQGGAYQKQQSIGLHMIFLSWKQLKLSLFSVYSLWMMTVKQQYLQPACAVFLEM